MSIKVSAPGKVHLMGEHAVVYGRPALLSAIDRRVIVQIRNQGSGISIKSTENDTLIRKAIEVFQKAFGIEQMPSLEISVSSKIPIGSGLGSSAAVAGATLGALMKMVKKIWNPQRINELTYEVEKIMHGFPSGADNTTAVFGGLVWYRREFDFLQSIWSLPAKYAFPQFVMIQSGIPKETTREMVQFVREKYVQKTRWYESVFSEQEHLTKSLLLAGKSGNSAEMVRVIRQGEKNLEKIGVVGNLAKRIIKRIESEGGAAKVSGAGGVREGSGIIICYHKDPNSIHSIAKKFAVNSLNVTLGEEGIRIESANQPINTNQQIIQ